MTHLNDAQKQALTTQIEHAPNIDAVNTAKQTAESLNNAMDQLEQAIHNKNQILADGNYLNADQANQDAFNQAVRNAENVLNPQQGMNEDQSTIEAMTNKVMQAIQNLNGNSNLAQAKQEANQALMQLPHLNDAQRHDLETQITNAPLVTDVDAIKQNAQTLDQAMEHLRDSIKDHQQTLNSEDYHDATADRQNDYNNAVNDANQIINATTPVMNPTDINAAANLVNTNKVALDGDENLTHAKQQATQTIDHLDHLNQAQIQHLQDGIAQATDIDAVNQHVRDAQALDTTMNQLQNAIANQNDVKQQSQFVNADPDKQSAYSDAVAHAQSIIDHQHGPNTTQPEVEQALTQVQQALQNLNGEQRLQDSKLHAQQAIDGLTDLNNPQKSALKEQVNHAPLITDVQQIEQQAGTLNQAMHDLRQSIDDNAEVKASSAYINEDPTEQHNYDQAVQHAQDLINEQHATLDTNVINQKTEDVNNSKQALQGVAKLQSEKDHAKALINQLPHLNDAQKHMEDALIDNETTHTAVKNDVTEAQQLDQYMDALQQSIADKQTTLDSSPYINADPNKKQDYDNAVQHAESIISGTTNPTINKDNVNQAIESVNATKQALNGVEKLAEDKQHAGETMNQFNQLTPAQQQALNDAITNAQTRDEVAQKVAQAEALNNAMQALKESVKDHQQVETSSQFTNEDPKQKDDYNQAVQHALDIINQATNPTLDQSQIEQATQAVINAKDQLHGEQKLAQDKQLANETIDHLQHLNAAQRQALQAQINQLPTRDEVAQKVAQAEALDESMKALRDIIQDHQQVESSSPFINEDSLEQNAYTNAIQQAEALINQTDHPTLDRTQVQQLTQAVTNAKDHLHGDEKLQNDKQLAVNNLNQLSGLNDAQRDAFESQINQAPTRNMVAESIAQANALNQAMVSLRNAIQNEPQVESSSQFINEDTPEQEAYKQAVSNAKAIINETTNPIMDKAQVDQTLQEVNDAIANLHGDQKLAQTQQQAIIGLDGLNNLNHDQLESAKDAVNQAPTRNDVAQIVQTANQLDQAMGRLKDVMNQANRESVEPNYTEASTDKQHAFNLALTNASHITDTQSGPNATQTEVENAITSLQQAMNDLDGNARVTNAKAQAIQDIDRQPHLNDEQKSAMKDQVNQATTLKSIEQIEDKSHQLDHATDQLQQAIDEHNHVTNTVDFTQADPDKQAAYNQAVAQAQQLVSQNATQQEVEQAITAIENAKHDLNGDEKVTEAKANAAQQLDQLTALNQAQHQAIIDSINNSNDVNDIQNIVNEATTLNHAMNELQQAVNDNNEPTKQSGNYINADTQLKHDFDEAITNAQQALDHPTGSNLTTDQINQLKDAINHAKDALNGNQRLNDSKSDALNKLDQLTHLNNAQKQMAQQQINTASTLNDVTQAIQKAATLDQSMNALNQYVQRTEAPVKASSNYIDADEALKANYNTALDRANDVLNKAKGIALTNAEVEALKQAIINAENALNGDQNVTKAKGKADQFIDNLENLNPNQRNKAHQLVAQADDLDTLNNIINNQIDLDDVMKALKDIVNNDVPNSENSINYQNADDDTKANFTQAKDQAIKLLKGTDDEVGDTNDIQGAIQALKDAMNQLNGDARLQDAKNKAIQSINKALADKLNDIDNANATELDKIDAKNKAEAMANQTINNINKATTNQAVDNVENIGSQAIDQIHANEIPKAQNDAKQDINRQSQELLDAIDHNPDLSNAEKEALKDQIRQLQQQANVDITGATTKEQIQNAKDQFNNALNQLKDLIQSKVDAKQAIKDIANAKRDEINSNPNLTDDQKAKALKEIDDFENKALINIKNARTKDDISNALTKAINQIQNAPIWEVDQQPVTHELPKASAQQVLVNGEIIVQRDEVITDEDVLKHINLSDQIKAKVLDTPNTTNISDDLEARVEITLANGSKVIVHVPVKVIEQALIVAKNQAIKDIEDLAQNKINDINNNTTLTKAQKDAAIAEVNKLKQQAIDNINKATNQEDVDHAKQSGQDQIYHFNPNAFTIDQAKVKAQKAIEDAIKPKTDEINARKDLSDKEKQDAIKQLNKLKDNAIQAINKATSLSEIHKQKDQYQVTINQFKPVANDLAKHKNNAISSIHQVAHQKSRSIQNSPFGTRSQKQDALNKIYDILNNTIRNIDNAQSHQAVDQALNEGIARILSVEIVGWNSNNPTQSTHTRPNLSDLTSALNINQLETFMGTNGNATDSLKDLVTNEHAKKDTDEPNDDFKHHKNSNGFVDLLKNTLGFVGISSLLAGFWFILAKRRKKEEEDETVDLHSQETKKNKHLIDDVDHTPLLVAKKKKNNEEESNKKETESSKKKHTLKGDDSHVAPLIAKKKRESKETSTNTKGKAPTKNKKVVASKKKKKKSKKSSKRKK